MGIFSKKKEQENDVEVEQSETDVSDEDMQSEDNLSLIHI